MQDLPPDIFPVVVLEGDDYQMGYQYGSQAGQMICEEVAETRAKTLRYLASNDELHAMLSLYKRVLQEFPGTLTMMEGIADGASTPRCRLSLIDILMLNTCSASFTMLQDISGAATRKQTFDDRKGSCTVFSAWGSSTRDGALVCGDSSDSQFGRQVVLVGYPADGYAFMCVAKAGQLSHHFAMNCVGLFIGNSGGDSKRAEDFEAGVPWTVAISHIVRSATSAREAADMIGGWVINMPENYHFADSSGGAVVVEGTASRQFARRAGDFGETDFLYSTNNFFSERMKNCFESTERIPHAGWRGRASLASVPRNQFLWQMLSEGHGSIDSEYAKMMWRFPGEAPSNPFDHEAYYKGGNSENWKQVIGNLNNDHVAVVQPRSTGNSIAHICAGQAGRIAHPFTPDKHWYLVDPLNAFVRLELAESVEAFLDRCEIDAHRALGEAHAQFMYLTPHDTAYKYLRERMSRAAAAYYRGVRLSAAATSLPQHERICNIADAASEYVRAQAYAIHVKESLVPPPTSAEELQA